MVFIRAKKVNGMQYFYLVKNTRVNGRVRQKVLKYLGKPINFVNAVKNAKKKAD